jgi:hypothetical protein
MGSIPIVDKHFIYDSFGLPIIQVENWEELSLDFLLDKASKLSINQSDEKLFMGYWANKILDIKSSIIGNIN